MSDNGLWWKAWTSSLDDAELEDLSIHEWFCWSRFGMYLKVHGNGGKIVIKSPAKALLHILRLDSWDALIKVLKTFPHYVINVTANETVGGVSFIDVKCENWNKYQGDYSYRRVKEFRDRKRESETLNETDKKRRDEKRGEKTLSLFDSSSLKDVNSEKSGDATPTPDAPATRSPEEIVQNVRKVFPIKSDNAKLWEKAQALHAEWDKQKKSEPLPDTDDEEIFALPDMSDAPSSKPGNF